MMEYYFLFIIGLVWITFATVQDLRKREVANWLNFSLIAFALAYRAFYSQATGDWGFFLFGLMGFGIFVVLAFAFYYGRVFAGGDAKLLMGLGAVLPFESYSDFIIVGGTFLVLLFLGGVLYTLFYSFFIVNANWRTFKNSFKLVFKKNRIMFLLAFVLSLVFFVIYKSWSFWIFSLILLFVLVLLYDYIKAVDSCMIKLVDAKMLTEGDWLERTVRVRNKTIGKSIHGLSVEDIKLLRKNGKKVWIKEGVPFVPAFFIAFLVTVYVLAVLGLDLRAFLLTLVESFS